MSKPLEQSRGYDKISTFILKSKHGININIHRLWSQVPLLYESTVEQKGGECAAHNGTSNHRRSFNKNTPRWYSNERNEAQYDAFIDTEQNMTISTLTRMEIMMIFKLVHLVPLYLAKDQRLILHYVKQLTKIISHAGFKLAWMLLPPVSKRLDCTWTQVRQNTWWCPELNTERECHRWLTTALSLGRGWNI